MGARIAMLGLGEAGAAIAADLVRAGAEVSGFDPAAGAPAGVTAAGDAAEAVAGCDLVLSVNAAAAALPLARSVAGSLSAGQIYVDANTSAPALKREMAAAVEPSGARFVDLALMAPVPGRGLATPALACGTGSARAVALLGELGMPVTDLGPRVGDAAARKLVRSVFMKGLAGAVSESLEAGAAAGFEPWIEGEVRALLDDADGELVRRLVEGSRRHATRREHEMGAAEELLGELGVTPHMTAAARAWLAALAAVGEDGR